MDLEQRTEFVDRISQGRAADALDYFEKYSFQFGDTTPLILLGIQNCLKERGPVLGKYVAEKFNIRGGAFKNIALRAVGDLCDRGDAGKAQDLVVELALPEREVSEVAAAALARSLEKGDFRTSLQTRNSFSLGADLILTERFQGYVSEGAARALLEGRTDEFVMLLRAFTVGNQFNLSKKMQSEVESLLCGAIENGFFTEFDRIRKAFAVQPEKLHELEAIEKARHGVQKALERGDLMSAVRLDDFFTLGSTFCTPHAAEWISEFISKFMLCSPDLVKHFCRENPSYIISLGKSGKPPFLNRKMFDQIRSFHIRGEEIESLAEKGWNLSLLYKGTVSNEILNLVFEYAEPWASNPLAAARFELGATVFGIPVMAAFADVDDSRRKVALEGIETIINFAKRTEIPISQFGDILRQVARDNARYLDGSAHEHFLAIAGRFTKSPEESLTKAKSISHVPRLSALASELGSPSNVFRSWNNLKRFDEIVRLTETSEALVCLESLRRRPGRERIARFFEELAFSSDAAISASEVVKMATSPDKFLANEDEDTRAEAHTRYRAANLLDIPHLDLSGTDIINGIAEGTFDRLSPFTPLEIRYRIPKNLHDFDLRLRFKEALGTKELKNGEARNVGKLFHEIKQLLPSGMDVKDFLEGASVPDEVLSCLFDCLYHHEFGVPDDRMTVVATLHAKSDPNGLIAAEGVRACMPLKAGKVAHFLTNIGCSFFSLRIEGDLGLQTIAHSVIMRSRDLSEFVPDLKQNLYLPELGRLSEAFSEGLLQTSKEGLHADNIQVTPNFKEEPYASLVEELYKDFYAHYLEKFGTRDGLDPNSVRVGQAYADTILHLPQIENRSCPLTVLSYSDSLGAWLYSLEPKISPKVLSRVIREIPGLSIRERSVGEGVNRLGIEDTLPVAFLEDMLFGSEPSLMAYVHGIQNALIASEMNNAAKRRPNLSLAYRNKDGDLHGYLVAYEGTYEGKQSAPPLIYVGGIAAHPSNRAAGGRLIRSFMDLYFKHYLETGQKIPILMELREKTAYQLVKRIFEKGDQEGVSNLSFFEFEPVVRGKERMFPVLITPNGKDDLYELIRYKYERPDPFIEETPRGLKGLLKRIRGQIGH